MKEGARKGERLTERQRNSDTDREAEKRREGRKGQDTSPENRKQCNANIKVTAISMKQSLCSLE